MGQGTEGGMKRQCQQQPLQQNYWSGVKVALCCRMEDSHADGLCLSGDLPQGEEQADLLSVVQEQGVTGRLGFQESLQGLDGLFHLKNINSKVIKIYRYPPTSCNFLPLF